MEKAVDVAESNMARFGLTQQEVTSRKKWVTKTRQQASTSIEACTQSDCVLCIIFTG